MDAKHREMLKRRLDGDTLDEIGRTYGVSRERIRQIVELEFSHMPPCRQDRYVKVFSTYDFKNEEFFRKHQKFIITLILDMAVVNCHFVTS